MTENAPDTKSTDTPAKRVAAKKTAAKKAATPPKTAASKPDPRSLYLPALPDGFEYTGITATGPRGESFVVTPDMATDAPKGAASLTFEGANLNRTAQYETMKDAITGAAKAAKAMAKIAQREADLAKTREEAFDL